MKTIFRQINVLGDLFEGNSGRVKKFSTRTCKVERTECTGEDGELLLVDHFSESGARCGFVRLNVVDETVVELFIPGPFVVKSCSSGGWLLEPQAPRGRFIWVPQIPTLRHLTSSGHIVKEDNSKLLGFQTSAESLSLTFLVPAHYAVDCVAWEVPTQEVELIRGLCELTNLETQRIFLWGSHTVYQKPADVYSHLIFGHIYENRYMWPFYYKNCSENDAHALYVALSGLRLATGKRLYDLLRQQLVVSVLARQSNDGGWHHGEWTKDMEAHLRLNNSALQLLIDSLEEQNDPMTRTALERGIKFVARHKDDMAIGTWLLHDSLELSEAGMKASPFKWLPSRALGKSPSNMLVLNTHLDALVVLDRYSQVTGDNTYSKLIESGKRATESVLNMHPLDSLYRILFCLFRLNLLPARQQQNLPMPIRALKRLAWRWLKPNFYRLTTRFPRLVMPGGYIERALTLRGMADDYHSINVMDLVRYLQRFPKENVNQFIQNGVEFVQRSDVLGHWAENKWKKYAVAFWAEAIYLWYTISPDKTTLAHLAEVIVKLEEYEIGVPPSLLGGNTGTTPISYQIAYPFPSDGALKVINVTHCKRVEFLVVNPTKETRKLTWERAPTNPVNWYQSNGRQLEEKRLGELGPHDWLLLSGGTNEGDTGTGSVFENQKYGV